MAYDPDKHHRRSICLRGYDYSQRGAYFVTICAQNRECLFGAVTDGTIRLNDAGQMVERWWVEIPNKFASVEIDAYVPMPNHFHAIVIITGVAHNAGDASNAGNHIGLPPRDASDAGDAGATTPGRPRRNHNAGDARPTLADIVHWFKTMTTNAYIRGVRDLGWPPFDRRLWQRNYWEHIIRDEADSSRIRAYIESNPARWEADRRRPAAPPNRFNQE